MVYGIVKQSGGNLRVHSGQGVGTMFKSHILAAEADQALTARIREVLDGRTRG